MRKTKRKNMATKKNTYSDIELEWAEKQLKEWKEYVGAHPVADLRDRLSPDGKVVSKIEDQGRYLMDMMKSYLLLTKEVDAMRQKEDKKLQIRGQSGLTPFEDGTV
jgi:hypothetical protein